MADDTREPAPPHDPDLTREPVARREDATRIGPCHLLQKIGEGGMGEVWVAGQREPIRRTVAVKVIKVWMETQQVVARFGVERQAPAVTDHRAITKVLGPEHPDVTRSRHALGTLLRTRGDAEAAPPECREVLALRGGSSPTLIRWSRPCWWSKGGA